MSHSAGRMRRSQSSPSPSSGYEGYVSGMDAAEEGNQRNQHGDEVFGDDLDINRKISVYKHVKKKAANDAQLLMNRIALIQKEEERARKKIQETKERAAEIIALRQENEKRIQAYVNATGEVRQLQQIMLAKNREQDQEGRKAREQRLALLHGKKREDVSEMNMEKKYLTSLMIQEQQREIEEKQRRRDEVKKAEEMMRWKKEQERLEKERKRKEFYAKKLRDEEAEAKRAEKLVKLLEKKEREWIEKLRNAQTIQDTAFDQLEHALEAHVPLRSSMSRTHNDEDFGTPMRSSSRGKPKLSPIDRPSPQSDIVDDSGGEQRGRPKSANRSINSANSGNVSKGSAPQRSTPGLKGRTGH